jgi:Outer membrane protein beta-barrel family/Carboxypeptidase regulatory-like domain
MRQILLFILLFCFIPAVQAQTNKGNVKGRITGSDGRPVAYGSVSLKTAAGDTLIKGSITNAEGFFEMTNLRNGRYILLASAAGVTDAKSNPFTIDSVHSIISLPPLVLSPASKLMKEVVVGAKKKFIEMQADKMVLNVENSIVATGNSVFEVIKKGPGVTSDKDDNLKMKGQIAAIYVDGKPFYLSGTQLTEYLKSLPADAVTKIELITNPSSKYDAEGSGGIINIKLKKNRNVGLNGSTNLGLGRGRYSKIWGGLNLNYRKDKLNVFGSANTGHFESFNQLTYNSIIKNNNTTTYQDRDNYWNPISIYNSYKMGLDYSITKKTTIGILINGNINKTDAITNNTTTFSNEAKIAEQFITNIKTDHNRSANQSYNINLKTELDTLGSEFNIDADYGSYHKTAADVNENRFTNAQQQVLRPLFTFRNTTPASVNIKTAKADLTKYFKASLKMEAGLKTSFVETDSNLMADSLSNNKYVIDYSRTNHFRYKENINAAYINITQNWKKWNVQAGLRAEQTNYTTNSITTGQVNSQSYISLFPSLFVTYKMNDKNNFNASYTRRIGRPSYQSLNPFISFVDPFTIFEGNPYLKPSFTNAVELKHGFRDFLFTSLSYSYTSGQTATVILQDKSTLVTRNITANVGEQHYVSLNTSASIPITKWWDTDNNIGFAWGRTISRYTNYEYNTIGYGMEISNDNTFTLPKNYRIQTSLFYTTPYTDGITRIRSNYAMSIAFQKLFWDKKASLKLNFANLIGPSAYRARIRNEQLDITWINRWEGRRVNLSFNYKFGNKNIKSNRQRKTASQEESNRVNL